VRNGKTIRSIGSWFFVPSKKIIPLTKSNEPFTVSGAKKSMVGKLNIKLNRTQIFADIHR
jgi:hypothetical protein